MTTEIIILVLLVGLAIAVISRKKKTFYAAPDFEERPIMNKPERFLFGLLRKEFPATWHIMSQVSYGAFLKNADRSSYMSINSKRADFVVLRPNLKVAVVFEYQGKGHYGFSAESKDRVLRSDQIKRQACQDAGILLLEVPAYVDQEEMRFIIQDIVRPPKVESEI